LYDSNNNLVGAVFEEHRITVRLEEMAPHLTNAVLVTEDRRFFNHDGIDLRRIVAAFVANTRAGEIVEGGSTITQQLVRSMLLDRDRTYRRKIIEAILARRLEERYSKRAILEAYLNRVYFGDGYYGVEAASIGYFGKPAARLSPGEAATLAGVIKGPSIYSPSKNPRACRERRDIVLALMHEDGMLSGDEFDTASQTPVKAMLVNGDKAAVADPRHAHGAEYFRDAVTRELIDRFGADAVYTGGLRVYTTLDRNLQRLAENVIAMRLRGVSGGQDPLQGALVAIDPQTGFVKAIVGGRSFHESPYNRATEARRQPGSAFKPFIFAAALESGLSPGSQLDGLDQPILTPEGPWLPNGEHETNVTNLRTALALSSNRAAAHLLQEVGIHRTLDLVQRMGINSPLPAVPALALGTGEVTLYELTSAYGVFANRGVWKEPTLIRRVADRYVRRARQRTQGLIGSNRLHDGEHDVGRAGLRNRGGGASTGVQAARGGQNRHFAGVYRRVVRRLHSQSGHGRVVWFRQAAADHEPRVCERHCRAGVGSLHEQRHERYQGSLVRHAGHAGEGENLPAERHARDGRMQRTGIRAGAVRPQSSRRDARRRQSTRAKCLRRDDAG
jgi:membrane peptidoglycan carboxypeptidase